MRRSGRTGSVDVLDPGESRERRVAPAARVRTPRGESWEPVRLPCLVYDPAEPRAALRLGVETPGARFVYTFWYRLMEPPREDPAMYAPTRPGAGPEPSGIRPEGGLSGPAPAAAEAAPPPPASGEPAEWPKDVHLPREGEEEER